MKRFLKLNELIRNKCDAVLLMSRSTNPDTNVQYYSGLDVFSASAVLYWKIGNEPLLFLGDARHKANVEKVEIEKREDIYKHIRRRRHKTIGVNYEYVSMNTMKRLRKELKGVRFVDISNELKKIREIKERREIKYIQEACRHTKKALRIAENAIYEEKKESDIMAEIMYYYNKKSLKPSFDPIVASGRNGLYVHVSPQSKKVKKTDVVIVDTGCRVEGYCSDMTRTFCIKPNKKQEEMIWLVAEANILAAKHCYAGMSASELYELVHAFFGKRAKYWKYGLGHGVGLDIHESPSITKESKDVLLEGMVFTIEPGLAIPGVGGARFEDTGLLTAKGFKKL